jgi:long-subunit fatty acid transport protein
MSPSDLVPAVADQGATAYRLFTSFEGTSVFFGYQAGVSYKINDIISVAAGLRYVTAKNTYKGYLRNLELNMSGVWSRASDVFAGLASKLTSIKAIPASLPVQTAGGYTLAQLVAAGYMSTDQKTGIETALKTIGVPDANIPVMTVLQISNTITGAVPQIDTKIARATATAALVVDQEADVEQTGSGITPFFSINISPSENLNIGLKYELKTKLELQNKTAKDFITGFTTSGIPVTMFPNGEKIRNDMPAMFAAGIDYGILPDLKVSAGFHYFFDKNANYGHKLSGVYVNNDMIFDNNYYELAAGLQYNINEKILVSGGYLYSKTGVNDNYQSDLTYSLTSSTVGFGGGYNLTDKMMINLGFSYSFYQDGEKTVQHLFAPTETIIPAREVYTKDTMVIAVGLDFSF